MATTEEAATARPVQKVLAWTRTTIDPPLRTVVAALPVPLRGMAGYHFGWQDEHGRPRHAGGGKAIRPALVLLAAQAAGGAPATALPGAVAVELVHNFSLVHDDVMDRDAVRRHRPTVWSVFGANAAILAGNALLSAAFGVLAHHEDGIRRLEAAVQALLYGQSADLGFEERTDVGLAECREMALAKTGALFGGSCAIGALMGVGRPAQVAGLGSFGEHIGLAFQIVDDLLGIWGDPADTGKPVYSDLRNRKKSLPVVAALTAGGPAAAELHELYHRPGPLSDAELIHAARLVEAAGGRAWCRLEADRLLGRALEHLHAAAPAGGPATELAALARRITRRDH